MNTKHKLSSLLVTAVLTAVTLFVSCAPESSVTDNGTVSVCFGELQARGIDSEVYDVDKSLSVNCVVNEVSVDKLFWSYKAEKADENSKAGQTTSITGNVNGFMPVKKEAGLNATIPGFAKGEWTFELQAFASADDRSKGTPVLFYGKKEQKLVDAVNAVTIATEWQYPDGMAENVHFEITTELIQTLTDDIKTPYSVSKVTVQYNGQTDEALALTPGNTSDTADAANNNKHTYTTVWTGNMANTVPDGTITFTYKIYVGDDEEISKAVTAPVMTRLTTNITGTATLTAGLVSADFSGSSVPDEQPTIPVTNVGDTVELGTFAGKPITWRCIKMHETGKYALMISENVLQERQFGNNNDYASSLVQTFLTGSTTASHLIVKFNIDKKDMVNMVGVTYSDIEETELGSVGDSNDKFFLLSMTEIESIWTNASDRVAYNLSGSATPWWLRSQVENNENNVYCVNEKGSYVSKPANTMNVVGVRPAFWLKLGE